MNYIVSYARLSRSSRCFFHRPVCGCVCCLYTTKKKDKRFFLLIEDSLLTPSPR